jgi:hypothetical protein
MCAPREPGSACALNLIFVRGDILVRFAGGGDKHGVTSHLGADQLADLVAYLESL